MHLFKQDDEDRKLANQKTQAANPLNFTPQPTQEEEVQQQQANPVAPAVPDVTKQGEQGKQDYFAKIAELFKQNAPQETTALQERLQKAAKINALGMGLRNIADAVYGSKGAPIAVHDDKMTPAMLNEYMKLRQTDTDNKYRHNLAALNAQLQEMSQQQQRDWQEKSEVAREDRHEIKDIAKEGRVYKREDEVVYPRNRGDAVSDRDLQYKKHEEAQQNAQDFQGKEGALNRSTNERMANARIKAVEEARIAAEQRRTQRYAATADAKSIVVNENGTQAHIPGNLAEYIATEASRVSVQELIKIPGYINAPSNDAKKRILVAHYYKNFVTYNPVDKTWSLNASTQSQGTYQPQAGQNGWGDPIDPTGATTLEIYE
jgi:hypothetical protein